MATNKEPRCSFCGKPGSSVRRLISGPGGNAYICDECVFLCQEIMSDDTSARGSVRAAGGADGDG